MAHRTLDGVVKEAETRNRADGAQPAEGAPCHADVRPNVRPGAADAAAAGEIACIELPFPRVRRFVVAAAWAGWFTSFVGSAASSAAGQSLDDDRSMSSKRRLSSDSSLVVGPIL